MIDALVGGGGDRDEEGKRWSGWSHLSVVVDSEFQTNLVVCQGRV